MLRLWRHGSGGAVSRPGAHDLSFADCVDCDSCREALTAEFLADALLVADKRRLPVEDVLSFALWWYHDANHPQGKWHPTGVVDMPAVHEA